MARLNWVGIPGRPEPGVSLKTPCRSVYRARGAPLALYQSLEQQEIT